MSPDSPANLHWVKLTGVVDTTARGRIGDEPFGLLQKKIELLPSPRLKEFLTILAWFKNDSGREVNMEVKSGLGVAWFTIAPGKIAEVGIEKGNETATAKNRPKKPFAQCALTPQGSDRYFDRDNTHIIIESRKIRLSRYCQAKPKSIGTCIHIPTATEY